MTAGIHLEPVSMGKGFVEWHVRYPSLARKNPALGNSYDDLAEACRTLKRHLTRDEVDDETAKLVEDHATDTDWGSDRS